LKIMPKYVYECTNCGAELEVVHSMKEKLKDCEECDTIESLRRIPSFSFLREDPASSRSPGRKVKDFIEESRDELKKERRNLQKKEYNDV